MSQEPFTQYPAPPNHPDFYQQYRQGDATNKSLYDVSFRPDPSRIYKNRSTLVVDSRDRVSGTIGSYSYEIPDLYYDVIAVELKVANIPNSAYLVTEYNNKLYFQDTQEQVKNCSYYQVCIPPGNYFADSESSVSLRVLIEAGMNEASQSCYQVSVNAHTNRFTIAQTSGSGFFNLLFAKPKDNDYPPAQKPCKPKKQQSGKCQKCHTEHDAFTLCGNKTCRLTACAIDNTMDVLLGFEKINYCGQDEYTAPFNFNLKEDKYIVLRITSGNNVWKRVNSNNSNLKDAYAVMPFNFPLNNFNFVNNLDNLNSEILIMEFKEPIKLGNLKIELLNRDGQVIDFNGHDHLLIFEVTSLSRFDNYHT